MALALLLKWKTINEEHRQSAEKILECTVRNKTR